MDILKDKTRREVLEWSYTQPREEEIEVCVSDRCLLHKYAMATNPEGYYTVGYGVYFYNSKAQPRPTMTAYQLVGDLKWFAREFDDQFEGYEYVTFAEVINWLEAVLDVTKEHTHG